MASRAFHLMSLPLSILLSSLLLLFFLLAENFSFGECSLLLYSNSTSKANDDFNTNNHLEMVTDRLDQRRPPPRRRPPPPTRRPPPPARRPLPPVRRPPPPIRRPPPPVRRPPPPPVRRPPPPPVRRPPPPPLRRPPPPLVRRPPPPPIRRPPPPPVRRPPPTPVRRPPPPPYLYLPLFSNYRLGLQWAPSICSQDHPKCTTHVPERFIIRSLQPRSERRPPLAFCNPDDKLDYHALVAELDNGPDHRLSTYWTNLYNFQDEEEHLSREWKMYGTCSGLSQLEYFRTALDLYETIALSTKLHEIDIIPGSQIDPSALVSKYHDEFGMLPMVSCVNRSQSPFMELLGEIQFEINKDGESVGSITEVTNLCSTTPVLFPGKVW